MTDSLHDNPNNDGLEPLSLAPTPDDLASRYDELLEFLLEFTHRQAQWDQRQQQLVDFQRKAVDQLRSTSFRLVERHQELQDASRRAGITSDRTAEVDQAAATSDATPSHDAGSGDQPERITELEEELKARDFEQKQLIQLTRLQRRKLAQQFRAQRAELKAKKNAKDPPRSTTDFAPILEQFQKELDEERAISKQGVLALQEAIERVEYEKGELQSQLQERLADIDELKRLLVESQSDQAGTRTADEMDAKESARLRNLEAELKKRAADLDRRDFKTRLQRRKLSQQFRAMRAELAQRTGDQENDDSKHSVDWHAEALQHLDDSISRQLDARFDELKEAVSSTPVEEEVFDALGERVEKTIEALKDDLRTQIETHHSELKSQFDPTETDDQPDLPGLIAEHTERVRHELAVQLDQQHCELRDKLEEYVADEGEETESDQSEELGGILDELSQKIEAQITAAVAEIASTAGESTTSVEPSNDAALQQIRDELLERITDKCDGLHEHINQLNLGDAPTAHEDLAPQLDRLRDELSERLSAQLLELGSAFEGSESPVAGDFDLTKEFDRIRDGISEHVSHLFADIAEKLEQVGGESAAISDELIGQLRDELKQLVDANPPPSKSISVTSEGSSDEAEALRGELEALQQLLRDAESEASKLGQENAELTDQLEDVKRHAASGGNFESAPSDLTAELDRLQNELDLISAENRSLNSKLAQQSKPNEEGGEDLDWESAKRKLLAELEAFDDDDQEERRERLSIEEVIVETDRIIAEKDEEIAELKHLLSHQSDSIGEVAVGATAIAELMDSDEIISQERENLRQLQEEWKEKLRTSEVELSLERARIARERAELDERLSKYKDDDPSESTDDSDQKASSSRGKWLERLGLRDEKS